MNNNHFGKLKNRVYKKVPSKTKNQICHQNNYYFIILLDYLQSGHT